jgi:ubiquinone/menaquinone biosynthesis C-methylase UbiE
LEHTERPWEVVKEIARICKTQGTVILSVPFLIGYHPCPNDFYRFSFQGVEALCQDDFELVQAWTYGGLDQILRSSDEFSTEYSYEKFLKIDMTRKKSLASSLKKKFWKLAYKVIGARHIPSIYSNVGCILKRK